MDGVYIAPAGYSMEDANPFTPDGAYDRTWMVLTVDEGVQGSLFLRRSPYGCYAVSLSPRYAHFAVLLADIIQYETAHGRKVIFAGGGEADLAFETDYRQAAMRPSDPRFLVHSTTLSRYEKIAAEGLLKSPNRLRREGYAVHSVGLDPLGEPEDLLDYIMFASGGVAPEIVVNSHLCGGVNYDADAPYAPQARMYFDGHRMVRDGIITRAATSMVYDHVPLEKYLVKTVTAADVALPEEAAHWTPATFAAAADAYIEKLEAFPA